MLNNAHLCNGKYVQNDCLISNLIDNCPTITFIFNNTTKKKNKKIISIQLDPTSKNHFVQWPIFCGSIKITL